MEEIVAMLKDVELLKASVAEAPALRLAWEPPLTEEEPEPAQREQAEVALALGAMSKLIHDYEVLRDAVRSHEEALTEVLEEIEYLSPQAQQLPRARNQTKELQQCLSDACGHGEAMLRSKAQSSTRLAELRGIFSASIRAEGDVQREALIDGMAAENAALWRMVKLSEVAESRGPIPFVAPPLKFPPAGRGRRQARRRPTVTEESSQASPELPAVPPSSPEESEEATAPLSAAPAEMQEQETDSAALLPRPRRLEPSLDAEVGEPQPTASIVEEV